MTLSVLPALQTLTQPQKGSLYAPLVLLLVEAAVLIVPEFAMLGTSVTVQCALSAQRVQPRARVTQALVLHALRVSTRLQLEMQHVQIATQSLKVVKLLAPVHVTRDISPL